MQTIVGVLRGGPSHEHEVSLASGAAVLANLPAEHFIVHDLYIDRTGRWHDRGRPTTPERALRQLDVVFVALHGEYGEDGEAQKILERFGVPYTGSTSFPSFLAMHKLMSKLQLREAGVRTPDFRHIERKEDIEPVVRDVIRAFRQPVVVKPTRWGSSAGVSIVSGYAPMKDAIERLFAEGATDVLVEEYVGGREATVGVVEHLRSEKLYTLPTVEIIPPDGDFFSYDAKYSGKTQELCPGNFSRFDTEELARLARLAHRTLGLRHYSRSDFIVAPSGIYYLETNTLPGLTGQSLLPKALEAVGVPLQDFFVHLVNLARTR